MSVHVTEHAIDRYIERISAVDREDARRAIGAAERMVEFAAAFGAHTVRLGNGAKLAIRGLGRIRVVTVLPGTWINRMDLPRHNRELCGRAANDVQRAAPACCGLCGMRCGHPIARACTRTECPLSFGDRSSDDRGQQ